MMMDSGHSRLPVYRGNADDIAGIVYARDLLRFIGQPEVKATLEEMLRPPLFIPESKRLDELLREFQKRRVHMAIVVDEYGGTEGIVTIEDLLEEIVGEIADEFDAAEPQVQVLGPSEVVLDGRASLLTLRELLNADVLSEDVDTVGGYLFSRLGRIPTPGDQLATDGLKFEVLATIGRRVKRVRVIRLPPETPGNETE
jgi:CBS domain containing-hemolysin-like protein